MRSFSFVIGVVTGPDTMQVTSRAFGLVDRFLVFFDSSALYEPSYLISTIF
jgi:hypothetical protein